MSVTRDDRAARKAGMFRPIASPALPERLRRREDRKERPSLKPMSSIELERALRELASQARRMRPPQSSKPEAWHEDKSELANAIDDLREKVRIGV